jgi:pimeloyl-ACP methyl ester carboxylesterase
MSDQNSNQDNRTESDAEVQRARHGTATNAVPMQRDHLGRPYWESRMSPASYQVRAEARVPPKMPGVVIFVHGVNSQGEWYDDAEKALCEGLNERLNRRDLRPNRYSTGDGKRVLPRFIEKGKFGNSPVIRFYWGYSAAKGTEKQWRIPMVNPHGQDLWGPDGAGQSGPWYWGGGPFQNGTNNLPQLWSSKGFRRYVGGRLDTELINTEQDRQLQDAPSRSYFSHAAQRLADLIDRIRDKHQKDTITIMSHSQGTMVALAATAICKTRAPDALIVMNSPYAMEDKLTDSATCGNDRPTTAARVNTFRHIAQRIKKDKRVLTEAELKLLHVGASEDMNFWRPDIKRKSGVNERENHGRLYVYFTPHDRVMGAAPLQSIGWQGVDDKLLAELGDTVKQRMLARGTPVGDDPGVKKFGTLPPIQNPVPGVKQTDFRNGNRGVAGGLFGLTNVWETPRTNMTVTINAEKVPHPVTADEMKGFEESRANAPQMGEMEPDPDHPGEMRYKDKDYRFFRSIYEPGPLELKEHKLWWADHYRAEPTNHSTLPKNQAFVRRVVSYDLPVGFCESYENRDFWFGLIKRADWTLGLDPYFNEGKLDPVPKPEIIDWTTVANELARQAAERKRQADAQRALNPNDMVLQNQRDL